jgi:hypothetical protein
MPAGDVAAIFSTFRMRLILDNPAGPDERAQARLLGNCGVDYMATPKTPAPGPFGNRQDYLSGGQGNMRFITANWQWFNYFKNNAGANPAPALIRANPPPLN